ncbi:MAG TPA: AAA family ATPase [Candidatus Acidoferrum sp.]|nr:AAA family ATPase [Candidatus Acidoferrum sp.]
MSLKSGYLAEPAFVGREREMKELEACLNSAFAKRGTTLFICGEAGTGKTRLVNEFLVKAKKKKIELLLGWCLSNSSVPYFPFIEAFDSYAANYEGEKKSTLFQKRGIKEWLLGTRQLGKTATETMPQTWKDQAFTTVTEELLNISKSNPAVLVLEDIHWADSASILLLHYLARAIRSQRVLMIATFRSEELNVDSAGHPHPLTEVTRLMKRDNILEEIKLSNLNQLNVTEISENMLNGKVNSRLTEKLAKESQGNPLFLVEIIRMLNEHRNLVQEKGKWQLATNNIGIPQKVKDIILRRLSALKQTDRKILEIASVIGDKFNPQLLGAVLGEENLKVLETLNAIMQSSSLVCVEQSSYWFDHSKSREVLYEEIPQPLRAGYHEEIAEKIETLSRNAEEIPVNDLAHHYVQAGNKSKAIKYTLASGQNALSKFSNTEAARYFTYVLDTISDEAEFKNERLLALEGLGDSYFARNLFEEATTTFEKLANIAQPGIIKLRALRKAVISSRWRGDLVHSLKIADEAQNYSNLDRLEYARIRMHKGVITALRGDMQEGLKDLEAAQQIFEEEYSLLDLTNVLTEAANFYVSDFQVESALRAAIRALALCEDSKDFLQQIDTYYNVGTVFFNCTLYQEALETYKKAINIGKMIGNYNRMAWTYIYSGALYASIGNLTKAVSETLRGKELAEKTDASYSQSMVYANLTMHYSRLDDLEHAQEYFEKFMKFYSQISLSGSKVAKTGGLRAQAIFFAAKGQYKEAYRLFEECLELQKGTVFHRLFETIATTEYVWALGKEGKKEEAEKRMTQVKRAYEEVDQKLEELTVRADLLAPKKTKVNEEFELRLDIENITKKPIKIVRIENLIPPEFKTTNLLIQYKIVDSAIDMNKNKLVSYSAKPIKLSLKATSPGMFNFNPRIIYADKVGKNKTCIPKPIKMNVEPLDSALPKEIAGSPDENKFEFKNSAAEVAFNFLATAFVEDYMRRRLPMEWSGWRTLMEITKGGRISKRSVYGNGSYRGYAIAELDRRGLIETRIFPKERGRGGRILKARVFYDKEIVKRSIEERVMKVGKNR